MEQEAFNWISIFPFLEFPATPEALWAWIS